MKIDKIEITNYKKIRQLVLSLDGENVRISGTTGQGKTTAISALWDLMSMAGEPITTGEAKGRIKITLSDGVKKVFAERKFTAKTKTLNIVDSEGQKVTAAEFKSWFASLADNPMDLLKLKPTEQLNALLKCVKFPAGFDLDKLTADIKKAELERGDLSRDITKKTKELGTEPENVEVINALTVMNELQAEKDLAKQVADTSNNVVKAEARIIEISDQLEKLVAEKNKLMGWIPTAKKFMADNVTDVAAKELKVSNLAVHNEKATTRANWLAKKAELDDLRTQHQAKQDLAAQLLQQKKDGLEAAQWPLDGLNISDGEMYYQGVPFVQAGDSQKMLVCGVLSAEQILTKKIHAVKMDGIESMSEPDFEFLVNIFNSKNIQVLSTRVTRGSAEPGELVIHDGGLV